MGSALGGALFGAVFAPIVGWIFLRRVSFARAIAELSAGIVARSHSDRHRVT